MYTTVLKILLGNSFSLFPLSLPPFLSRKGDGECNFFPLDFPLSSWIFTKTPQNAPRTQPGPSLCSWLTVSSLGNWSELKFSSDPRSRACLDKLSLFFLLCINFEYLICARLREPKRKFIHKKWKMRASSHLVLKKCLRKDIPSDFWTSFPAFPFPFPTWLPISEPRGKSQISG